MGRGASQTATLPEKSPADVFLRHFKHPHPQSFRVRADKKADRERAMADLETVARRHGYVVGTVQASKLDPRTDEFAVKVLLNEIHAGAVQLRRQTNNSAASLATLRHLDTVLRPEKALDADIRRLWDEHQMIPTELDADRLEQALTLLAKLAEDAGTKALLFVHEVHSFAPGKREYRHALPSLLMAYAHVMRKHPQVALVVSGPAAPSARALVSYPDAEMMFSGVDVDG